MSKSIAIEGKRFGGIVALWHSHTMLKNKNAYYMCICDCGTMKAVCKRELLSGDTTSCGCAQRRRASEANKKHGACRTKEYDAWCGIKRRCFNENFDQYADYGGRGITMCDRWNNSFEAFLSDVGEAPSAKHSIDRIDNNGNYAPGNCRWATRTEQLRNTRRVVSFEINGETKPLVEWCEIYGVSRSIAYQRMRKLGWSLEEALGIKPCKRWGRELGASA